MTWRIAATGGAFGTLARHGVNVACAHLFGRSVPYATAAVNLLGSACIGLLAGLIASGRVGMSANLRTFVFVGLIGQTALGLFAAYAAYHIGVRRV